MSSSSYRGRHYGGRHRVQTRRARPSRAFGSSFVLPTAAAAALVVTATGATVAHPAPAPLELGSTSSATAVSEQASDEAMVTDLAERRNAASTQAAALQGRNEQVARAARSAQREAAARAAAQAAAKAKAARDAKRWVRPINVWHVTSGYEWRWGRHHDGIDLGAPTGTPLYAMSQGVVINSMWSGGFGNKIEIRYWDGSISWYGHLSKRIARKGDAVKPGQLVGRVGDTGHSFGSHLHFEMQQRLGKDTPIDPVGWLKRHGLN